MESKTLPSMNRQTTTAPLAQMVLQDEDAAISQEEEEGEEVLLAEEVGEVEDVVSLRQPSKRIIDLLAFLSYTLALFAPAPLTSNKKTQPELNNTHTHQQQKGRQT